MGFHTASVKSSTCLVALLNQVLNKGYKIGVFVYKLYTLLAALKSVEVCTYVLAWQKS